MMLVTRESIQKENSQIQSALNPVHSPGHEKGPPLRLTALCPVAEEGQGPSPGEGPWRLEMHLCEDGTQALVFSVCVWVCVRALGLGD